MAIYDLGTASLAANGEVVGVGTTWKAPLTLIRVGATIIFKTSPLKIYTISEIISDTQISVYNPNSETVPAGTSYAILAHDGITVQGLAQDVAETLRYYQSKETSIEGLLQFIGQDTFDWPRFEQLATQSTTGAAEALASQIAAAESASTAAESASTAVGASNNAQNSYNRTVAAINAAGNTAAVAYFAEHGIGSTTTPLLGSLDWQTMQFYSGGSYQCRIDNMVNIPADLSSMFPATNTTVCIDVLATRGINGSNVVRISPSTTSNAVFRVAEITFTGATGSRNFYVRELLSVPGGDAAAGGSSALRVRGLLDVYSKNETFQKSLNFSDVANKSKARTNLDVYSKSEVNALLTQVDIKKDFGAVGDGVTDDTQALLAAVEASRNNAIAIHIPKGNYLTSQPLNFLRPATIIGEKGARISLTSGPYDYVIQMDHRDVNLDYWAYNSYMSNIIVDGNGYANDGFSLRGVISSRFDNLMATNIRKAGLHCWWTQLCVHNNFVCSGNVEAFTTTPTYGILIDSEPGSVNFRGTSADLFINPTCEHVTESGIEATFCSNTTFIGGTSEGNKYGFSFGHESDLGIPAVTNTVIGCDLEVNSGGDVILRKTATGNLFNGVQSGFQSPSIQVNGARANRFVGGSASGFDFYNGASGNHVEGTILFGQNATVIDNSKLNSWEALYNINTGLYTDSSNPVQKRVQLSGGSILFNPLRTSLATVVIDSSPVVIDVQDNARDAQRMDFIIYNLSGDASPSVSFSNKFRVGSFTPPSAGRQIGMSFVYDANFAHWTCVGISPEGRIY